MNGLSGLLGSSNQMDSLVDAYKQTQQKKLDELNAKKSLLQTRKSFYSTFKSRIDSLVSEIDKLTRSSAIDKFSAKSITSSDSKIVSASAKGNAILGDNSIKVEKLAKNDVLISNRANLTDAFNESAGNQTFNITIGDKTKEVSVDFDGTETYEQAMKKIVVAINRTSDIEVNASFVKDTNSTGRISLTAKNPGSENKILFSNNSALSKIGLDPDALFSNTNSRVVSTNTQAGYLEDEFVNLDSKFQLNGITITRSTNKIDDVLDGVTLNLLKTQDLDSAPVNLKTEVDSSSVQNFVKGLLTSINDIISNISSNTDIKRNDPAMTSLFQGIKNILLEKFGDSGDGELRYLTEIGIKFDKNGFIAISDEDLFKKELEKDPQKFANMFVGSNGLAKKVDKLIAPYKGSGGLVASRSASLNEQINNSMKKIESTQEKIDFQADALKKQYQNYLKLFYQAQNQSTYLSGFSTDTSGLLI